MDARAKDKANIPVPAGREMTSKDFRSRLSKQGFLLFKETIGEIACATHKLNEQSITIAEYTATLTGKGIPDEWITWLTTIAKEMADEKTIF